MLRTSPIINNPSTAGQMVQISCWASPVAQEPKTTLISRTVVQGGEMRRRKNAGSAARLHHYCHQIPRLVPAMSLLQEGRGARGAHRESGMKK